MTTTSPHLNLANPALAKPVLANPVLANPVLANPVLAKPTLAKPAPGSTTGNGDDPATRLAEEFDRHYEPLDILLFGPPHALREALDRALRIADACGPAGGPIDRELLREIWCRTWNDLTVWLRCLPRILAQREMRDEAIELCGRLAPLFDARAFLTDRALLLAEAGRHAEALRQAQTNIRLFRRDPVVLRRTCETLWALGHAEEALLLYDEVLERLHVGREADASRSPIVPRR